MNITDCAAEVLKAWKDEPPSDPSHDLRWAIAGLQDAFIELAMSATSERSEPA